MKELLRPLGVVLVGLSLWGCVGARYVQVEGNRGVVAIPTDSLANRQKADELMAARCPSGYVIDREAEAVIGTTSDRHIQRFPDAIGDRWESRRTTRTETEWRIYFHCK